MTMRPLPDRRWLLVLAVASLVACALLVSSLLRPSAPYICPLSSSSPSPVAASNDLRRAVLHYATSSVVPQQSVAEINISFSVLLSRAPCNFLVFGLGYDSVMWSSFNPGGTTVFLEEDRKWTRSVLQSAPNLVAHTVKYPTQLSQAPDLLRSYRSEPYCLPPKAHLEGNRRCRLALSDLPAEIYGREWDLIMIDAPRGYFNEAPGRMGAIWSAAVMARLRKGAGETDVFLHDVDRKVEKEFAREFLCKKYQVGGTGRLWHFRIPPASGNETGFC